MFGLIDWLNCELADYEKEETEVGKPRLPLKETNYLKLCVCDKRGELFVCRTSSSRLSLTLLELAN